MDDVKNLLFNKRNEVGNLFNELLSTIKNVIDNKNKEIFSLKKGIEILNNKNINDKINLYKIIINELSIFKNNNKLLEKTINAEIKSNQVTIEYNNKINQIKSEYDEKLNNGEDKINTKDMAAFKIIAIKLEETEKINKNCFITINELKSENKNIKNNIELFTKENKFLKNKVNILENKNLNLLNLTKIQTNKIKHLTEETQDNNKKITKLKNYFVINFYKVSLNELTTIKNNNKLLRKIVKIKNENNSIIIKYKDKINRIKIEYEEKLNNAEDKLDIESMAAFKLITTELEEKEKINKNCLTAIKELKSENKSLKDNIELYKKENENLKDKIINLDEKNYNLSSLNKSQLNTIETLTREMKSKSEKISDLKNYFLEILDNYNDIIQEVE